jgi:hypothetical protein
MDSAQQQVSGLSKASPPRSRVLNFVQPVNRQYHLPSQDEAAEKALEKQTQLQTELSRTSLEDLEKRLDLERKFVAGIRKVPDEILLEIMKHYLRDNLPSRRLASVCKFWKALLKDTPTFWRNLKATLVTAQAVEHEVTVLRRRIELSRSALLDVTLDVHYPTYDKCNTDLFKLISKTGIERWRSLKLYSLYTWETIDISLEGVFTGKLLALQSLHCESRGFSTIATDPLIPIYRLIIQSSPPIKYLTINGPNPSPFPGSSIFRLVHELDATATVVSQLVPLDNLKKLTVNGTLEGHDFSFPAWPPLPTYTRFEHYLTRQQLSTLSRQNVTEFVVSNLIGDESGTIIDFPELTSLGITQGGIYSIENILAPKLTQLQITTLSGLYRSRKLDISDTISFLRSRLGNIILRPTTLTLDCPVNTKSVLTILQHWPQLQHFTLAFGDEFTWNVAFPTAFTKKKNPLCPKLTTLTLILRIKDFAIKEEQWKKMVMSIYLARRNTPLQTIQWMFWGKGGWEWHSPSTEAQNL